jgi:transcriptional regulator with XRE-family HTH domain
MDDQRVGSAFRSVRIRRRLRQVDVGAVAGISGTMVSRMERGHFESVTLGTIRAVAKALDIRVDLMPRWRAGDLDRLLNARHSELHELVARYFSRLPLWVAQPEVSFAVYGERGVIDILAWHPARKALLVIELKTDIADVNELVGTVDRKGRLAIRIAIERGWVTPRDPPPTVSIWIIVGEGPTNRRRVGAHRAMLRAAFPTDGRSMPGWLRDPIRPVRALSFWAGPRSATRGPTPLRRVRRTDRLQSTHVPAPRSDAAAGRRGGETA